MTDNSGALSIDFLIGFTIFMITFIWVATLVPGLFIGLQSHTIDFDAVAYRTGVILAEDPGATSPIVTDGSPWESQTMNDTVARLGLAISKDTPNILNEHKVKRFFCSTAFIYPDDYRTRIIFGDYPYRFNISLKVTGEDTIQSVGDIIPDNYGYIRRDVKIKGSSNATINAAPRNTADVEFNQYSLMIDSQELLMGSLRDPVYQIDSQDDRIMINITNLTGTLNSSSFAVNPNNVNLNNVTFYQRHYGSDTKLYSLPAGRFHDFTYEDGNTTPVNPPVNLKREKGVLSNISLIFEPGVFFGTDIDGTIFINLTFGIDPPQQYLNNSGLQPFDYTYSKVTQPVLKDGVLEVAVW